MERAELTNKPDLLFGGGHTWLDKKLAANAGNLVLGTILGEVSASGELVACKSSATDGSQIPRFICSSHTGFANKTESQNVRVLSSGGVNRLKLIFVDTADNLQTLVQNVSMENHLTCKFVIDQVTGYENLAE